MGKNEQFYDEDSVSCFEKSLCSSRRALPVGELTYVLVCMEELGSEVIWLNTTDWNMEKHMGELKVFVENHAVALTVAFVAGKVFP